MPKVHGAKKAVVVNYRQSKESWSIMEALCCGCGQTWGKMFGKKTHETDLSPDEIDAVREVWQK